MKMFRIVTSCLAALTIIAGLAATTAAEAAGTYHPITFSKRVDKITP
jgi:hypothetical protein